MRWPGGPAGQWKMSPFERISTSFSHSMARRPRVTSPQCGASHQPEVYPLRSPIRTRVMTYEDIRHASTLISPGPTRSAETAGTTVGRLDADRTSKPCSMSRASLTSSSGSTGWNAASTSPPADSNRCIGPPAGTWNARPDGMACRRRPDTKVISPSMTKPQWARSQGRSSDVPDEPVLGTSARM